MMYLVFECSKGRKDLIFVASSKELAFSCASDWSDMNPSWSYRVYQIMEDEQTFYVNKLSPLRVFRNGFSVFPFDEPYGTK